MKKILLAIFLIFCVAFSASAQLPITAEGYVYEKVENNLSPLLAVSVVNQDGQYGVLTDYAGHYRIQVQHGVSHLYIDYSFEGYQDLTKDFGEYVRRVSPSTTVYFPNVIMEQDEGDDEE